VIFRATYWSEVGLSSLKRKRKMTRRLVVICWRSKLWSSSQRLAGTPWCVWSISPCH
jgi:hypothetical protein